MPDQQCAGRFDFPYRHTAPGFDFPYRHTGDTATVPACLYGKCESGKHSAGAVEGAARTSYQQQHREQRKRNQEGDPQFHQAGQRGQPGWSEQYRHT